MAVVSAAIRPEERKLSRRGERRKQDLLHCAMMLFSEKGYEGTTTRGIAERCGATEAVLFRYFPSKQQLFREVVAHYSPPLRYEMPYEELRGLPFKEALKALFRGYLDNCWTNRQSMRLFLLATFHDEAILRDLGALFEHRKKRLTEMLSERIASDELRTGIEESAAQTICYAVTGFTVRMLRSEPPDFAAERDAFLDGLATCFGEGLLALPRSA